MVQKNVTTLSTQLTLSFLTIIVCITTCQGENFYEDTKRLTDDLLLSNNYSSYLLPLNDMSGSLVIKASLSLIAITGLDDVTQKLVTNGFLFMIWKDERLTWDPFNYNGVDRLKPWSSQVWRPQILLTNSLVADEPFEDDHSYMTLLSDGSIYWTPRSLFSTYCTLNLKKYPFDVQNCKIEFCAKGFDNQSMQFVTTTDQIQRTFYFSNQGWELLDSYAEVLNVSIYGSNSFSCPTFTLTLKRRPTSIVLNVILPIVLLSLLNNVVFLIPEESGEKISYAITVLLSIGVFMGVVSNMTPQASDVVPALTIYLFVLMLSSVLTAAAAIVIVFLYNHGEKPNDQFRGDSNCLHQRQVNKWKSKRSICPEDTTGGASSPISLMHRCDDCYVEKSQLVNKFCFVTFSLVWFAATAWYFIFTNS